MRLSLVLVSLVAATACSKGETTTPPAEPQPAPVDAGDEDLPFPTQDDADRPTMTVQECEAAGSIVGDPGDGSVHKAEYTCQDGQAPIGRVESGIEGAVCCPNPA